MRLGLLLLALSLGAQPAQRQVRRIPGFVALWDFVKRTPDGRFDAYTAHGEDFSLDAQNYVRQYWGEGREATYADFPVVSEGPFGQAVVFRDEPDRSFRPLLLVPRTRLHDSGLDRKGPGQSVSMVVWVKRESGNHALAGIWHEGTDLGGAARVESGRRQYALFAGLAANPGAAAAHVSENGARSFGDRYARHLAVTRDPIPLGQWACVGFVFDHQRHTVTAYLDGQAREYWVENPARHPFFQWAARAWRGEFAPPETKAVGRTQTAAGLVVRYPFTRVRADRELVAVRANPAWFPHDLYAPPGPADGGPFTIGRVIHTARSVGFTGAIGGVAVFDRALRPRQMRRLAAIASGRSRR